jgi:hypothetical protein
MSKVVTTVVSEPSERKYHFVRTQDVEPILDHNKQLRSMPQKSDWGRHIASIPNVIYEKWFNEYNAGRAVPDLSMFGPEFGKFVERKLNDPDWKFLRCDK